MPGSEIPDLQGVFRFVSRLHTMSKRGMRGALADCPRCHFGMLENLHILIEQRGVEGAIPRWPVLCGSLCRPFPVGCA